MKRDAPHTPAELLKVAEEKVNISPKNSAPLSPEATQIMLQELHVHQIKLEIQNEELRRAQIELDSARARYFELYDLAPMGYITLNKVGVILDINLTATTLLNTNRKMLISLPFSKFINIDDTDNFYRLLNQQLITGEPQTCELRMIKHDGTLFWAQLSVTVANDFDSVPTFRIALIDITIRKHMESELQKLDKLQSVGTLAGGIAHDFNNILQGLYGNIAFAKEDLPVGHSAYIFLEEAEKSMHRAVRLTKQLLTFAKGGAPIKEILNLNTLVEDIARFDLSGSNVILVYRQDDNLWPVIADKGQIQQAVSNLVINAREAMPNGGHLAIFLENLNLTAKTVLGLNIGRYVKITMHDEGIGINSKVISRIFDPYFTTKQTGSGLGLATVWSIIKQHDGHIDVNSELGKGTCFTFYLPSTESLQSVKTKIPIADDLLPTSTKPLKILVMDDEESVCAIVTRMLKPCGYSVAIAHNRQETITLYKKAFKAGTPFDLIILDLTIPGEKGGVETIKDILEFDPKVRAIVSSGYAEDPVMADPTAYGFKGVVAKPYTARTLREIIVQVVK